MWFEFLVHMVWFEFLVHMVWFYSALILSLKSDSVRMSTIGLLSYGLPLNSAIHRLIASEEKSWLFAATQIKNTSASLY